MDILMLTETEVQRLLDPDALLDALAHGMRNELSFSSEVAPSRLSLLVWLLRLRRHFNRVASKQAL